MLSKKIPVVVCPTCGGDIIPIKCICNLMFDSEAEFMVFQGECEYCGSHYEWIEHYTYVYSSNLEKIEKPIDKD